MNNTLLLCANIYECPMAELMYRAQPLSRPLSAKKCRCGMCDSTDSVLDNEAMDLVAACPICSEAKGIKHDDKIIRECLHEAGSYCPYCNCEYDPDDNSAYTFDTKLAARFLKIFMGDKPENEMRELVMKLIRERSQDTNAALGCEGFCKLMEETIGNRMDDNEKKKRLEKKVKRVITPMRILKKHCEGKCENPCCNEKSGVV